MLRGTPEQDSEWIIDVAPQISHIKKRGLIDNKRIMLREAYFEYQKEGLSPKDAIEKVKNLVLSFLK